MMIILRVFLAGLVGLLAGGGLGWGLSMLLITTFSSVLGPRYSEFDMFGVIGAALFGAAISCVVAAMVALLAAYRPPTALHMFVISGVAATPAPILIALTIVNGEWAWLVVIYLAIFLGTVTGVGASLLVPVKPTTKSFSTKTPPRTHSQL